MEIERFLETLDATTPQPQVTESEPVVAAEPKKSKNAQEKEHLRKLRQRLREHAIASFLEGRTYEGILIALGAGSLSPYYLEQAISHFAQSREEGLSFLGIALVGMPYAMRGSWPGGRGWLFIDPILKGAAVNQKAELVLHASKIALGAPLFLAATLAQAYERYGASEETEKVARVINEKAIPIVNRMNLERILGPRPVEKRH